MIHLIVTGHGEVATGLLSGLRLLAGECPACVAIDFCEGMSGDALEKALQEAVQKAGDAPILFLTDIIGGTPFRASATIAQHRPETEVISGVNAHILLEAVMERGDVSLKDLVQQLVENGRAGIQLLSLRLNHRTAAAEEDGI